MRRACKEMRRACKEMRRACKDTISPTSGAAFQTGKRSILPASYTGGLTNSYYLRYMYISDGGISHIFSLSVLYPLHVLYCLKMDFLTRICYSKSAALFGKCRP